MQVEKTIDASELATIVESLSEVMRDSGIKDPGLLGDIAQQAVANALESVSTFEFEQLAYSGPMIIVGDRVVGVPEGKQVLVAGHAIISDDLKGSQSSNFVVLVPEGGHYRASDCELFFGEAEYLREVPISQVEPDGRGGVVIYPEDEPSLHLPSAIGETDFGLSPTLGNTPVRLFQKLS